MRINIRPPHILSDQLIWMVQKVLAEFKAMDGNLAVLALPGETDLATAGLMERELKDVLERVLHDEMTGQQALTHIQQVVFDRYAVIVQTILDTNSFPELKQLYEY